MLKTEDTIAAIATPPGQGGVAIIRVSGPRAWEIALGHFSHRDNAREAGRIYHGWMEDTAGQLLDEVLILLFKAPHSYSGEDVAEIHCHGGEALSHKILSLCLAAGARPAQPGEFTLRAFLNGKMDLTQAESVMDLVSANSERLISQASANLKNRSLGRAIEQISGPLIDLQSRIVASIDFPDEVAEPDRAALQAELEAVVNRVQRLKEGARRNRMVRDGLKVAILGMPNSGKSSLFNALLATDRSIVTDIAGTTRDVVSETLEIAGIAVTLIDTAGIRETRHSIEMMGIERSWQAAEAAHFIFYVVDATVGLLRYDTQILSRLDPRTTLIIGNKKDLIADLKPHPGWYYISARTGEGIEAIHTELERMIRNQASEDTGVSLSLNQRQVACCEAVAESLHVAWEALANPATPLDIVTIPLTEALGKLDELMGRDTAEEVLSSVFSQFCVGK